MMNKVQKPRLIVMPLVPDTSRSFDGAGLGIHFLLGNLFGVHPELTECWFGWRVKKIFQDETAFTAYCRGIPPLPDIQALGKQENVRYWLTGRYSQEDEILQISMVLHDIQGPDDNITLPLSLDDGITDFRYRFQQWLGKAGLAFPRTDTVFWPEWITPEGLDCLGRGLKTLYLNYLSQTGSAGNMIDLTWFDRAVDVSPRSYLAHDLLGWALYKNQEIVRAESCFETALTFNDKGVGALSGLLWCAVAQKDRDRALVYSLAKARVTDADPKAARAWVSKKIPD
ncbi:MULTISPECIES: tetratricopeptide repeat protein [Desulfotignum]|jgi:hypothetical protein|uniref:Uncharacterized protein n=1 Tax=Desulfotignum phosphitoxidans DSM 13687 TaxID=1286635 RepID=S0G7G6_9BACT|nr:MULTISPECIES: hypothetical protein [Desulfotignum]EMS81132.1 hypothetical protein Dpo_1c02710 [Desulfotignum phosphitoxidans DSM 13687]